MRGKPNRTSQPTPRIGRGGDGADLQFQSKKVKHDDDHARFTEHLTPKQTQRTSGNREEALRKRLAKAHSEMDTARLPIAAEGKGACASNLGGYLRGGGGNGSKLDGMVLQPTAALGGSQAAPSSASDKPDGAAVDVAIEAMPRLPQAR